MEQYRDGEEVYMCLQKNTYGTPDGGFLWAEERTTMLFENFSKQLQPWTITMCLMDQCLFYFTYTTTIRVDQSEGSSLRSGSAARTFRTAEERLVIDGFLVHGVWLVIWTDDFDMVGTDDAPMFMIQDKCNKVWAVKQVPDTSPRCVGIFRNVGQVRQFYGSDSS